MTFAENAQHIMDAHRVVREGKTYVIIDRAGTTVARLRVSLWNRTAAFDVGGKGFIGYFRGFKEAVVERDDGSTAFAATLDVLAARFVYGSHEYELKAASSWNRSIVRVLRNGHVCVAEFETKRIFRETIRIGFAMELPAEINVFIFWIVLSQHVSGV